MSGDYINKISIIDYGIGNISNVLAAINYCGAEGQVITNYKEIESSDYIVLPGVGAFKYAIEQLRNKHMLEPIKKHIINEKPFLGICLGMQLMLNKSYEFGEHKGLGLIEGEVKKITSVKNKEIKIPHTGWNEIYPSNSTQEWKSKILENSLIGKNFYFVHSFVGLTKKKELTIANCNYYDVSIPAVVANGNIFGCQFHPEKSSDNGLKILKNFCNI